MCTNIKTLANFEPPATDEEVRASALQFVRKLSGTSKPSHANEAVFNQAVEEVTAAARQLIASLEIKAPTAGPGSGGPQGAGAEPQAIRTGPVHLLTCQRKKMGQRETLPHPAPLCPTLRAHAVRPLYHCTAFTMSKNCGGRDRVRPSNW